MIRSLLTAFQNAGADLIDRLGKANAKASHDFPVGKGSLV